MELRSLSRKAFSVKLTVRNKKGQEFNDLRFAHLTGMPFSLKQDKLPHPIYKLALSDN